MISIVFIQVFSCLSFFIALAYGEEEKFSSFEQFADQWAPPLTANERKMFAVVESGSEGIFSSVRFLEDATFRGVECTRGMSLKRMKQLRLFLVSPLQEQGFVGNCKYKNLIFKKGILKENGFPHSLEITDSDIGQTLEIAFGVEETIKARLKKLGVEAESFYVEKANDYDLGEVRIVFRDTASIGDIRLSKGGSVTLAKTKSGTKIKPEYLIAIRAANGQFFDYKGWPCSSISLKNGMMESCYLAKDFKFKSIDLPKRTSVKFKASKAQFPPPAFLFMLPKDVVINGKPYKKHQTLKVFDSDVTTDFDSEELDYLNGRD